MYARLGFAAALALNADIYLSDDVVGAGDEAYRAKCFHRLIDLCQSGKTLFYATHKFKLVEQLCTRVIWLHQGEVREDGNPAAVLAAYRMNVLEEQARARKESREPRDEDVEGEAEAFEEWFKEKYGTPYPLPAPKVTRLVPIEEDIGEGFGTPVDGGIAAIECVNVGDFEQVVADNETFVVRLTLDVPQANVPVDVMLEVVIGKTVLYQSLPKEPIHVEAPGKHLFKIPIESRLLPDGVYLVRARAVLALGDSGERFVSTGFVHVATNNCGPEPSKRIRAFWPGDKPPRRPLRLLKLDWRVEPVEVEELVAKKEPAVADAVVAK
jgi:hypothetical protein